MKTFILVVILQVSCCLTNSHDYDVDVDDYSYDEDDYNAPSDYEKVVGGQKAEIADFPYQVSLRNPRSHYCGGAIISEYHIVTAGHCVFGMSPFSIRAYVGSSSRFHGGQVYRITRIFKHDLYDDENLNYDIAILLVAKITFGPTVQPIQLTRATAIYPGMVGTISGWGYVQESGVASSASLQSVRVPVLSQSYCIESYQEFEFTEFMFCAGFREGMHDACQGDSGGPLVIDKELAGIISWGIGCARSNRPGVYTNIPAVREFIRKITGL